MNESQIETAARHACKLLGLDPDTEVTNYVPDEQCEVRALNWQLLAPKVREQWAIMEGIHKVGVESWS
jgi:hypothetical protein